MIGGLALREDWEAIERQILAPRAAFSAQTRGRLQPEEPCAVRTEYQRDRDRIIHCKAFRRLMHKTQVFVNPSGDHFRTRLTHTLEVAQIARTMSRALRLNEDLTEAIALGHDLGHTPFGHAGERSLERMLPGFGHHKQSLRVVDVLEKDGRGLNLTFEVRDGIVNHRGGAKPATQEGRIVHLSDRIAYINHDIDDAVRAGLFALEDLPKEPIKLLGLSHRSRIDTMVAAVISASEREENVCMEPEIKAAAEELRAFLGKMVYFRAEAQAEEKLICRLIEEMFTYYAENPQQLPADYQKLEAPLEVRIADYIAGMTDTYALNEYQRLFDRTLPLTGKYIGD